MSVLYLTFRYTIFFSFNNSFFFFFNDTATTEIYTLSLHDALPILPAVAWASISPRSHWPPATRSWPPAGTPRPWPRDRKSTRLNSSHLVISYAVFCLKKKKLDHIYQVHTIHKMHRSLQVLEHEILP